MLPKIIRTGIHRYEGTGVRKTEMATQYRKAYVPVTLDVDKEGGNPSSPYLVGQRCDLSNRPDSIQMPRHIQEGWGWRHEQYADLSRRLDEAVQRKVKFAEAMSEDNKWLTLMKSVSGATMLSHELVDESVELVKVHEDGSIELVMKYGDIYALTVQSIKEVQEAM